MPYRGYHRVPIRRPAKFTAFAGAATAALVATSAGAAAEMIPTGASSASAATTQAIQPPSAPVSDAAPDLPHSTSQVMEIRAVNQASAVSAARAKARRLAAQRAAAERAAQLAAQKRAQQLAAQKRAQQLAAQKQAQQLAAQRAAQQRAAQLAAQQAAQTPQQIAQSMLANYGWSDQWSCLNQLWTQESSWNVNAENPSGAYGIPQSLPGSKMASAGSDWQTNPTTQIKWGLGYIQSVYGTPCSAWSHEVSAGWY